MKLKLFFLLFINILSLQLFAQDTLKYDINKFTTPDIVRRRLGISGGVSPYFYQNRLFLEPLFAIGYQQTINTRKKINTFDITLFKYSTTNLIYKNQNHFTSWGGSVDILSKLTISPFVGFGIGRIENLDDEMQAIYFTNELEKKKILLHKLDKKELLSLSTLIANLKNKRALNSKKLLNKEIGTIDSFLITNQIINISDTLFTEKLYNKQLYNYDFGRSSGYQSEFRISPSLGFNLSYLKTIPNGVYDYGITGSYNYTYKKQISLIWQQTISVLGSSTFHTSNNYGSTKYLSYNSKELNSILSGLYHLDYFIDYRNCFSGVITQNFENTIYLYENSNTSDLTSSTGITIALTHFYNPHLKLNVGYSLSKSISFINYDNYLLSAFLVTLNYSFF
jgi:hypothetical protein